MARLESEVSRMVVFLMLGASLFWLTGLACLPWPGGGCDGDGDTGGQETPAWLQGLIERFESDPVANPPLSVWRYKYRCQTVYYVPPRCCDIESTLYDADGNIICSPDGGFTGWGDGRCPDFFDERTDGTLIWQDER